MPNAPRGGARGRGGGAGGGSSSATPRRPPARRAARARVGAAQRPLLTLINDTLAHARLEAGRVEFHPRPLRVAALLASLDAMVSPMAEAKGIAYAVDACGEALGVVADEERARQILLNL